MQDLLRPTLKRLPISRTPGHACRVSPELPEPGSDRCGPEPRGLQAEGRTQDGALPGQREGRTGTGRAGHRGAQRALHSHVKFHTRIAGGSRPAPASSDGLILN